MEKLDIVAIDIYKPMKVMERWVESSSFRLVGVQSHVALVSDVAGAHLMLEA